eukprot:6205966-Pyramimonas_sp.AAC.1
MWADAYYCHMLTLYKHTSKVKARGHLPHCSSAGANRSLPFSPAEEHLTRGCQSTGQPRSASMLASALARRVVSGNT